MKQRTYSIRRIFILISVLLLFILTASVMSFLSYAADVSQNRIRSAARSTLGTCQDFLEMEIDKMTDTIHHIYTDNYEYQVLSRNSGAYEGRMIQENSLRRLIEERVPAAGAIFLFDLEERVSIYKFGRAYTAEDFLENVAVKERFYRYCAGLTWKEMGSWQLYRDAVSEAPYLARVYQKNDLYVGCLLDLRRVFSAGDTEAFRLSFLWNGEALTGHETFGELLAGQNEMSEKAVPHSLIETVRIAETPVDLAVVTDADLFCGMPGYYFLAVLGSLLLLAGVLAAACFVFSRYMVYPIRQIAAASAGLKQNRGMGKIPEPESRVQEIRTIYEELSRLMEQKVRLETENEARRYAEEHTQLQYYQLQTKSHFFVNCLKSLYHLMETGEYGKMKRMILAFSNHIRFVFRDNLSLVTLKEELAEVNDYYNIVLIDQGRPVILLQNVDQSLLSVKIPPLIIQTFVENTVKHAAPQIGTALQIVLDVERAVLDGNEMIRIRLRDNGMGYSKEMLTMLNREEVSGKYEQYHVGISNLKRRIRLIYQEEASLSFYNDTDKGACVLICLPCRE